MNGLFVSWNRRIERKYGKHLYLINNFNSDQFRQRNGYSNDETELKHFELYFEILFIGLLISIFVVLVEVILNLIELSFIALILFKALS